MRKRGAMDISQMLNYKPPRHKKQKTKNFQINDFIVKLSFEKQTHQKKLEASMTSLMFTEAVRLLFSTSLHNMWGFRKQRPTPD